MIGGCSSRVAMEPVAPANNRHNPREHAGGFVKETPMRTAQILLMGVLAGALTTPVLAKNSNSQQAEEKSAASTCSAYQQAPDGSWTQLPCKETGERSSQAQTQHKPPAPGTEPEAH